MKRFLSHTVMTQMKQVNKTKINSTVQISKKLLNCVVITKLIIVWRGGNK